MGGRGNSLWRHADFMRLWSAETISQLGTQVTLLALPLTAILVLDATPFEVGVLTALEVAPFLLVGLPAGVWVDRMRRRPLLIAGDLVRAAALGTIPLAHALGQDSMAHLYGVAFVTGVATVFFDVAYQSYLPSLVDRDRLPEGNAKLEVSRSAGALAGPSLAGALVQLFSAPAAILVDAVSYVGSALFVGSIRRREPPVQRPEGGHPPMRAEISSGLRFVVTHPLLRPIAACTSISNLFFSMASAVLVLFAVRDLGLSPGKIGLAFGIGNVGFLLGALVADRAGRRLGIGRAIVGSIVLFGVSGFLPPLASETTGFALITVAGGLGGFGTVVYNVNQVSLRQAITPERMLGKMNATMRFVVWGTLPLGAILGGVLGGAVGLRSTLWVTAFGGLLAVVPPVLSPVRSLVRIPELESSPQSGS
jgi:MFS family permease